MGCTKMLLGLKEDYVHQNLITMLDMYTEGVICIPSHHHHF
jgi:hypothetical protein